MDFFAAQEAAQRATRWLLFIYALAVACIVGAVYFAVSSGFAVYDAFAKVPSEQAAALFSRQRALWVLGATLFVIGSSSLFKGAALRRGGSEVCQQLGGTRIDSSTRRRLHRRLMNVVEEMSIAAGAPIPAVYVLEREGAINAFAAGYCLNDAAIAVTQGALDNLARDELEAVIAHEFSHILHGDMRLNTRLIAALHGILVLTIAARLLRHGFLASNSGSRDASEDVRDNSSSGAGSSSDSPSDRGGTGALLLAVLVVVVLITLVGAIGAFFARMIQAAVCRQRELLADAKAVQLTRDEARVRQALRRVAEAPAGTLVHSPNAQSVAHMFFAEGVNGWLSSHPPLPERLERLGSSEKDVPLPRVDNPAGWISSPPERLLSVAGSLKRADLDYAKELLTGLPEPLKAALQEPAQAEGLVYLLLTQPDPRLRELQWQSPNTQPDPEVLAAMHSLARDLAGLDSKYRLPLLELALPALRGLVGSARVALLSNVERLIASDGKTELFEFVLQSLVLARLQDASARAVRAPKASERKLAARVVLTAMARIEIGDEKLRAQLLREISFDAGYDPPLELVSDAASDFAAVRVALDVLRGARPKRQRQFLRACELVMLGNGRLSLAESELFRAIAVSLNVPLPPHAIAHI